MDLRFARYAAASVTKYVSLIALAGSVPAARSAVATLRSACAACPTTSPGAVIRPEASVPVCPPRNTRSPAAAACANPTGGASSGGLNSSMSGIDYIVQMAARWAHFDYEETGGVATVTFSRPERLNSLTFEVYADIRDLTRELRSRGGEVQVLVIRGRGRGFCSGGDVDEIIGELLKRGTRDVYEFAQMTGECVRNLREMPQPVVASVNGIAAAAGAVLASASAIRRSEEHTSEY